MLRDEATRENRLGAGRARSSLRPHPWIVAGVAVATLAFVATSVWIFQREPMKPGVTLVSPEPTPAVVLPPSPEPAADVGQPTPDVVASPAPSTTPVPTLAPTPAVTEAPEVVPQPRRLNGLQLSTELDKPPAGAPRKAP